MLPVFLRPWAPLVMLAGIAALPPAAAPRPAGATRPAGPARPAGAARPAADATGGAEAALRAGRYEEARTLATGRAARGARRSKGASAAAAAVVAARAEMALGLYDAARERLETASGEAPGDLPLRRVLLDLYETVGDRAALGPLVDRTYDDWKAGRVDRTRADDLMAVAAAVRLDNNWQDANDVLRAAVRADRANPRPNVLWGTVFLEKHAAKEADRSFRAALEVDPDNPDARVGLAAARLQLGYDSAGAEADLDAALRINPRHAGALALRAEMALDGEDSAAAARLVEQIRRTNPRDPRAAAVAAARARLLDDDAGYRRERDARAAVHPTDGDFFAFVADVLVRHRRYDDARAVAEEGAAAAPQNARCQSVLGTTLLRLGEESSGIEALRRAWKLDPYDARTFNLLELFEKVVPGYDTFDTKHLRFRVARSARPAIELVVAPFLEETYDRYLRKYGQAPAGPITFELYTDPDAYAVRTVGLPGISVAAVCFGRVITASSPTNGALNWGMVLSHELAHVFAIHLSRSRVPRWFTEGLSELETMRARPEWRRRQDRELWGAMGRGELGSLASLSSAFVRARNGEEANRAYAAAAAALDYLDRRFGFAVLREALRRYGRGERGLEVVAAAAGVTTADLERGFREDLARRWAHFDQQYLPAETLRTTRPAAEAALASIAAGAGTARAVALARLGLAQLAGGDAAAAGSALARADEALGGAADPAVTFLAGELALARRRADDARAAFLRLLPVPDGGAGGGHDGYDVRVRLALAEIHRRDLGAAEEHLARAVTFDPESVEARGLQVELFGDPAWQKRRVDDRLGAIAATLRLEPAHGRLAKELVAALLARRRFAEVAELAPIAIFIVPGAPELHAALGQALASLKKPAEAKAALERALALGATGDEAATIRRLLATLK